MIETIDISNDIVRLEIMDMKKRLAIIRSLKGPYVLDRITCTHCLTMVNVLHPGVLVNKRHISIGSIVNTVLEPECPCCGCFIPAEDFFHAEN